MKKIISKLYNCFLKISDKWNYFIDDLFGMGNKSNYN